MLEGRLIGAQPGEQRLLLLSDLLGFHLVDKDARRARLVDMAIELSDPDYPPVVGFLLRRPDANRSLAMVPGPSLREIDEDERIIVVESLLAPGELTEQHLERAILLKRDVRDALVLDIHATVATRVNDIVLRMEGDELVLSAADLSPWAVVRWIARGLLPDPSAHDLLDWRNVEFLRGDPRAAEWAGDVHHRVDHLHPPEIARMIDALPYLHAAELLTLTKDPVAADALEIMTAERQVQVFEELAPDYGARLLGLMAPDVAADLLGRIEADYAQRYLERMRADARERVLALLSYPPDTAGGIMTNDVVTVAADSTVEEARLGLREPLREPDFVYYVYVVEAHESRKLLGVITLRDLLVADDSHRVRDFMLPDVLTIHPLESATAAARRLTDYHLAALPVVNEQGELLGAITFDAAVAQLAPPSWRDQSPRLFS